MCIYQDIKYNSSIPIPYITNKTMQKMNSINIIDNTIKSI